MFRVRARSQTSNHQYAVIATSPRREAAQEYSPGRKPWVVIGEKFSPNGAKRNLVPHSLTPKRRYRRPCSAANSRYGKPLCRASFSASIAAPRAPAVRHLALRGLEWWLAPRASQAWPRGLLL